MNSGQFHGVWPWKQIWRTKAPYKVACFCWTLAYEAYWRNSICKGEICLFAIDVYCVERMRRKLIIYCTVASLLSFGTCSSIFSQFSWVMPRTIKQLQQCWTGKGIGKRKRKIWETLPECIWWVIWKERNQRCFESIYEYLISSSFLIFHFNISILSYA